MSKDTQAPAGPMPPESAPAALAAPRRRRRWIRWTLLIAGPLLVLAVAGYVYLNSGRYAETDDAYVKADMVAVSAAVGGPIVRVAVEENGKVAAGDVVFRIDDAGYRAARDRAASQLEAVSSFIRGLEASYKQTLEQLELAKIDVAYAEREVARERSLSERDLGSESDLDAAEHRLDSARQQIPIIDQQLAQLRAQLGGNGHLNVEDHPAYRVAKAAFDNADLELGWTTVRAPIDGVATHVPLVGAYAAPGAPIMSVVSADRLWVEANFKETELTHVVVGQPVVVRVDTYKEHDWRGRVDSISPATGAEFSVIPAQNASGNWVKVAQRIPVRISLDGPSDGYVLRAGMSAVVEIDTGYTREAPEMLRFMQRSRPEPAYRANQR